MAKHNTAQRAGLVFSASRIRRSLVKGRYAKRIGRTASIYLAAVTEYILAEVLELAGNATKDNKRNRIIPRYVQLAVRQDDELGRLFRDCDIAGGGVVPHVHRALVPPEKKKAVLEKKVKSASSVKVARKVKKSVVEDAPVVENGDNDAAEV